jgi:hypothetical protein
MNIYEFADIIDKSLQIIRYANQAGRFSAQFESCEVSSGSMLEGTYGDGKTPQEAIADYAKQIIGKRLVFYAMSDTRRQEYVVPSLSGADDVKAKTFEAHENDGQTA